MGGPHRRYKACLVTLSLCSKGLWKNFRLFCPELPVAIHPPIATEVDANGAARDNKDEDRLCRSEACVSRGTVYSIQATFFPELKFIKVELN
jgi:hypothetical protein